MCVCVCVAVLVKCAALVLTNVTTIAGLAALLEIVGVARSMADKRTAVLKLIAEMDQLKRQRRQLRRQQRQQRRRPAEQLPKHAYGGALQRSELCCQRQRVGVT